MSLTSHDVIEFLKGELNVDEPIDPESALFSTGVLDSVAMLNLIGFVEENAKIEVRASDVTLENFDTAQRIEAYVTSRL
ncbi:acyl carrier protein [Rubellimicrobium rubrum]|uniref:Acyl carrier protein n=1 Tax=Rubellimicrobium rubrum TaxID=2585369 RepID=A0A5C4MVT3_9RHOB|nr:acyl carrier protein [Rubellimicrobium rubrum]TNC49138.1 acyl carrier protein [Rubellimicrobium rubrum]